jgi:hypothetical protein
VLQGSNKLKAAAAIEWNKELTEAEKEIGQLRIQILELMYNPIQFIAHQQNQQLDSLQE